jgi:hypothetical protein
MTPTEPVTALAQQHSLFDEVMEALPKVPYALLDADPLGEEGLSIVHSRDVRGWSNYVAKMKPYQWFFNLFRSRPQWTIEGELLTVVQRQKLGAICSDLRRKVIQHNHDRYALRDAQAKKAAQEAAIQQLRSFRE